jgi:hypothetical protein
VSEVTESAETSEDLGPGPHLAQVDPPHPFRSALKTIVIAAIAVSIAIGLYVWLGERPPVARGDILTMNLYPVHTLINNGGGGDTGMAGTAE